MRMVIVVVVVGFDEVKELPSRSEPLDDCRPTIAANKSSLKIRLKWRTYQS